MTIMEKMQALSENAEAFKIANEMATNAMDARSHGIKAPTFEEVIEMAYTQYFA